MLREREAIFRIFLIIFDGFVIAAAYVIAVILRNNIETIGYIPWLPALSSLTLDSKIAFSQYLYLLIAAVALWCLTLFINGMYRSIRTIPFFKLFWLVCKSGLVTFITLGTMLFLFKVSSASRLLFFLFMITSFILILAEKILFLLTLRFFRRRGYNYRSILVVGTGRRAAQFIGRIRKHPEWGLRILGAIDDEPGRGINKVDGVDVIGTLDDITSILHNKVVDEVVFVVPRSRLNNVEKALHACEMEGVVTTFTVDLFDMKIAKATVSEIDNIPLLRFRTTKIKEWQLVIKRIVDLVISGLILLIISPLFLVIAIIIKLTSRGPVFFKQERVGLNGRKFILFKFRTMRQGAENVLSKIDDISDMDKPEFRTLKLKWITPIGKLLRKFSLDELPQFINVFKGDMSLIGPRPTVPEEVEKYEPWQRRRFSMKPGITCLWQVSGRNNIGHEDWMKLDLKYVDTWSIWLDLKILIKTVPAVLFGTGAY